MQRKQQISNEITHDQFHALIKKAAQPIKDYKEANKTTGVREVKHEVV